MTYLASARGVQISRRRALRELTDHGLTHPTDRAQFDADMGVADTYLADAVLRWLGY